MRISKEGRTAIAYADAKLTFSNRSELTRLALEAMDRGAEAVVVDLSATQHVDAAAWSGLAVLAHSIRARGGSCFLTNVRPELLVLLGTRSIEAFIPVEAWEQGRAD
jgi:anti-anti-sigma regulatory factor